MFVLEKKELPKIKVQIGSEIYELKRPKVGELEMLERLQDDEYKSKSLSLITKYLKGVGLPEEVTRDLLPEELNTLVEYLSSVEKKKFQNASKPTQD